MDNYCGFDTEIEYNNWIVSEFATCKGVEVTDVRQVAFVEEVLSEDGCCEVCYVMDVKILFSYEGHTLKRHGDYTYDDNDRLTFTLYNQ